MRSLRYIVKTQTPSEAQKAYGNYRKLHYHAHGLSFSIENPRGSIRSGVDSSGKSWERKVTEDYGYVRNTSHQTTDSDHLDCFLSPKFRTATVVHVIDQISPETGLFDEHKCMIGWDSQEEAKRAYLSNYERGWKGLGDITTMTMSSFKQWLKEEEKLDTAGYVVKKAFGTHSNRALHILKEASGTGVFGNTLSPITDKLKKLFRSTRAVSTNATQNLPGSPKELFTTSYPSANMVIPPPRPKSSTGDK